MDKKIDIYKSAGILIKNRKFLISRSKGKSFFISPGGKIEQGENKFTALQRELHEELHIKVEINNLKEFDTFYAMAQGTNDKYLKMEVIFVEKWAGIITPSNEVEEILWINSNLPNNIELGSIFKHDVLPRLKQLNLID